ncbi:histidine phosphatase family protein [Candidatus Dojkabacteria bacterium]|uniref:Histidine phosphatase family protein n=1 Tax=Candidatus Dojkabacteria bacterium TaxID=2099670 RepID=A0A955L8C6_9BACT|nr:histidine phosphatase family protein [Candidatus Dojkabacteria bacterium]
MDILKLYAEYKKVPLKGKIYVVRHGQTEWNVEGRMQGWLDSSLTEVGRQQAENAGVFLKDKNIDQIFASPLGRTQQTAKIIQAAINPDVPIILADSIKEGDVGDFAGKLTKDLTEFFTARRESIARFMFEPMPGGGESFYDIYLRVAKELPKLVLNQKTNLIVTHEGASKSIRSILTGESYETYCEKGKSAKNNNVFEIDLESRQEIVYEL